MAINGESASEFVYQHSTDVSAIYLEASKSGADGDSIPDWEKNR
jgi:hypothetical protein